MIYFCNLMHFAAQILTCITDRYCTTIKVQPFYEAVQQLNINRKKDIVMLLGTQSSSQAELRSPVR